MSNRSVGQAVLRFIIFRDARGLRTRFVNHDVTLGSPGSSVLTLL
jgi:hypothetical protein